MFRRHGGAGGEAACRVWPLAALLAGCGSGSAGGAPGPIEAGASACPLATAAAAGYEARVTALGADLDALVTGFEQQYKMGDKITCPAIGTASDEVSQWGNYAFAKLARGTDATGNALATSSLACMFTYQDMTPNDPNYGVFRFHVDDPAPTESDNSTEFALEPVAWLLSLGLVPSSTVATYATQIQAGLDVIDAHDVCPNYTNICFMQNGVRLALGAALTQSGQASLAADGTMRVAKADGELATWESTAKTGGVREFDSPTYSEVQLETLLLARQGAILAGDTTARARVEGALAYLWSDFAANVFASRGTLAPPYSRTYDFACGQGATSYGLWLSGLVDAGSGAADLSMAAWLSTLADGGYRAPGGSLCWAAQPTRTIASEFQQMAGTERNRYAYVTPDFSLGSATADYPVTGNIDDDLLVAGSLVSSPATPLLSVVPDWLDAPLAPVQAGDFDKVTHLPLDPAVVQHEGALLLLARVPAADPDYVAGDGGIVALVNLTTNLIVPAQVDAVLVDGVDVDATQSGTASATPIVVAQNETGVMGMAVIAASGLDCADDAGTITETGAAHVDVLPLPVAGADPALRLAIRHLSAPPSDAGALAPCFARVALLMVARHCDGSGCGADLSSDLATAVASAQSSFDTATGDWAVTVQAPDGGPTLHVARATAVPSTVTATTIDGVAPTWAPLSINGTVISLEP
jgi:hypothetical protein